MNFCYMLAPVIFSTIRSNWNEVHKVLANLSKIGKKKVTTPKVYDNTKDIRRLMRAFGGVVMPKGSDPLAGEKVAKDA